MPHSPEGVTKGPLAYIGLAGWSEAVSRYRQRFPAAAGSGLERYASALTAVEVNVSFYRQVRRSTYESWAQQTPDGFAFSVKMSRAVTHFAKLSENAPLDVFWESVAGLEDKLRAVLVQLPPSLSFDRERATAFFARMRATYDGMIAVEARHASWLDEDPRAMYRDLDLSEVATTVPPDPESAGARYYRLHGDPRRYRSPYSAEQIARLAAALRSHQGESFTIFDNTASSAGIDNALSLRDLLEPDPEGPASG